jgi:hypothetical protein
MGASIEEVAARSFRLLLCSGLNGAQIWLQDLGLDQEVHPELAQPLQVGLVRQFRLLPFPCREQLFEPLLKLPRPAVGGRDAARHFAGHQRTGPTPLANVQQSTQLTVGKEQKG